MLALVLLLSLSAHADVSTLMTEATRGYCQWVLSRHGAVGNAYTIIHSFYDEDLPRYLDKSAGRQWPVPGQALRKYEYLDYAGKLIVLFHQLTTEPTGSSYAGLYGIGIIGLKKFTPRTSETLERLLAGRRYLTSQGLRVAMPLDLVRQNNSTYLLREHVPGPSFKDLREMLQQGKIGYLAYQIALAKYELFVELLQNMSFSGSSPTIDLERAKQSARYFEGQWVVVDY